MPLPHNVMWIEWEEAGRHRICETFKELAIEQPADRYPSASVACLNATRAGAAERSLGLDYRNYETPNTSPIVAEFDLDQEFVRI